MWQEAIVTSFDAFALKDFRKISQRTPDDYSQKFPLSHDSSRQRQT
jgi:hypothetical protein